MTNPYREVLSHRFLQSMYARRGHGTIALTLSCGHTVYRKSSIPIPLRALCRECGNLPEPAPLPQPGS